MEINDLVTLENKYGGYVRDIPIKICSKYDPNYNISDNTICTGNNGQITKGMCGGDRMSTSQMSYGEIYKNIFNNLVKQPNKLVEIGILTGIGLAIWSDFFPKTSIYGLDLDISNFLKNRQNLQKKGAFSNNNIDVYTFDQYKPDKILLDKIAETDKLDIVIDDGCHYDEAIIITFDALYTYLSDDFIYIIEDNHNAYKKILMKYESLMVTNIDQITLITNKHNILPHKQISHIKQLNSSKHYLFFTSDNKLSSHSTNNGYGNKLLDKYNVGQTIKIYKNNKMLKLNIIKKINNKGNITLFFDNKLDKKLLEDNNRQKWIIS